MKNITGARTIHSTGGDEARGITGLEVFLVPDVYPQPRRRNCPGCWENIKFNKGLKHALRGRIGGGPPDIQACATRRRNDVHGGGGETDAQAAVKHHRGVEVLALVLFLRMRPLVASCRQLMLHLPAMNPKVRAWYMP